MPYQHVGFIKTDLPMAELCKRCRDKNIEVNQIGVYKDPSSQERGYVLEFATVGDQINACKAGLLDLTVLPMKGGKTGSNASFIAQSDEHGSSAIVQVRGGHEITKHREDMNKFISEAVQEGRLRLKANLHLKITRFYHTDLSMIPRSKVSQVEAVFDGMKNRAIIAVEGRQKDSLAQKLDGVLIESETEHPYSICCRGTNKAKESVPVTASPASTTKAQARQSNNEAVLNRSGVSDASLDLEMLQNSCNMDTARILLAARNKGSRGACADLFAIPKDLTKHIIGKQFRHFTHIKESVGAKDISIPTFPLDSPMGKSISGEVEYVRIGADNDEIVGRARSMLFQHVAVILARQAKGGFCGQGPAWYPSQGIASSPRFGQHKIDEQKQPKLKASVATSYGILSGKTNEDLRLMKACMGAAPGGGGAGGNGGKGGRGGGKGKGKKKPQKFSPEERERRRDTRSQRGSPDSAAAADSARLQMCFLCLNADSASKKSDMPGGLAVTQSPVSLMGGAKRSRKNGNGRGNNRSKKAQNQGGVAGKNSFGLLQVEEGDATIVGESQGGDKSRVSV